MFVVRLRKIKIRYYFYYSSIITYQQFLVSNLGSSLSCSGPVLSLTSRISSCKSRWKEGSVIVLFETLNEGERKETKSVEKTLIRDCTDRDEEGIKER
jgi:hypothetical protein